MGGGMGKRVGLFDYFARVIQGTAGRTSDAQALNSGNPRPYQKAAYEPNQETEIISSTDEVSKKKSVAKRSSRRQTLLTRENQLGAGNLSKKSVLG